MSSLTALAIVSEYIATARWRPVPVFVNASLELHSGGAKLVAAAEANPQLKMPLQNVHLSLPCTASCAPDARGTWDGRTLGWRLPQLLSSDKVVACTSAVMGEELETLRDQPVIIKFECEGVTISGIELEVQMGGSGHPVAKLNRRFVAGDYKVSFDLPEVEAKE
ncbi:MAG: hypothetical protein SGPRY_005647 [Prymnesium sp.]